MGAGASVSPLLDAASALKLDDDQKHAYEAYHGQLTKAGMTDDIIRLKMVDRFREDKGDKLTSEEIKITTDLQGESALIAQILDIEMKKRKSESKESKPETEKGNIVEDYENAKIKCTVCRTTFKTETLLERHIKFSYMHAKTLQDIEATKKADDRARRIAAMIHESILAVRKAIIQKKQFQSTTYSTSKRKWLWAYERVKVNILVAKTTEMLKAFYRSQLNKSKCDTTKLLYDGSKLFWRQQYSIELHMYLHDSNEVTFNLNNSPVIEVIGFDVQKHRELLRLYIHYHLLRDHLKDKIIDIIYNKCIDNDNSISISDKKLSKKAIDIHNLNGKELKIMNDVITDFIHSKLDIMTHPDRPTQYILTIGGITDEDYGISLTKSMLTLPPNICIDEEFVLKHICPVEILRRRRTTEEERSQAFADFQKHKMELSDYSNRAATHILRNTNNSSNIFDTLATLTEAQSDINDKVSKLLHEYHSQKDNIPPGMDTSSSSGGGSGGGGISFDPEVNLEPTRTKAKSRTFDGFSTISSRSKSIKMPSPPPIVNSYNSSAELATIASSQKQSKKYSNSPLVEKKPAPVSREVLEPSELPELKKQVLAAKQTAGTKVGGEDIKKKLEPLPSARSPQKEAIIQPGVARVQSKDPLPSARSPQKEAAILQPINRVQSKDPLPSARSTQRDPPMSARGTHREPLPSARNPHKEPMPSARSQHKDAPLPSARSQSKDTSHAAKVATKLPSTTTTCKTSTGDKNNNSTSPRVEEKMMSPRELEEEREALNAIFASSPRSNTNQMNGSDDDGGSDNKDDISSEQNKNKNVPSLSMEIMHHDVSTPLIEGEEYDESSKQQHKVLKDSKVLNDPNSPNKIKSPHDHAIAHYFKHSDKLDDMPSSRKSESMNTPNSSRKPIREEPIDIKKEILSGRLSARQM